MFIAIYDKFLGEMLVICPYCGNEQYIFPEDPIYKSCDECKIIFKPLPFKMIKDIHYRIKYHRRTDKCRKGRKKEAVISE